MLARIRQSFLESVGPVVTAGNPDQREHFHTGRLGNGFQGCLQLLKIRGATGLSR